MVGSSLRFAVETANLEVMGLTGKFKSNDGLLRE